LVVWCDGDHEEDTPSAVVRTLTVDGGKPVLLDLCDVCDKAVQDVVTLMEQGVLADKAIAAPPTHRQARVPRGTNPGGKPSTTPGWVPVREDGRDRRDCVEPDCGYVGATRSALGQHILQKHGGKLSDYDWTP
jgi:hypothetical protein